jgi:hypothetical protein
MSVPHITQSRSQPPASSHGQGLAPSASTLTVPTDMPSAPGASCTSNANSIGVGVPRGTKTTKGKYRGITRRTEDRRTIGADEVLLLSP